MLEGGLIAALVAACVALAALVREALLRAEIRGRHRALGEAAVEIERQRRAREVAEARALAAHDLRVREVRAETAARLASGEPSLAEARELAREAAEGAEDARRGPR